ncbi:circadian clock-controlled protein daywake-like [Eupeodes corollae]|uniref:circadian clock-controlled protein daywake-like n=1 Tax=Eupeodes corollae TaxID=290404 RepID=UPI0024934D6C|nr:circadian clock-controlled protein daywake-like [Eupeodes corollae]
MSSLAPVVVIIFLLCISLQYSESFEFPSNFELCHRSDNECIVKNANKIIHEYPHGYPEIFLPDFEPMRLEKLEIKGNPDSPINFNLLMTDIEMHGYSNGTFTKFTGFDKDPHKVKIETESTNPRLIIRSKYKVSGKLLVVPITGEGDSTMTITGLKIKTRSKPTFEMRDGKTYLKFSAYKLQVEPEKIHIDMTNLFNGDNVLSENMLNIMNENWKLLWDEMSPKFNEAIIAANLKVLNTMHAKIPYEDMFLPD